MDINEISNLIRSGRFDSDLNILRNAIEDRHTYIKTLGAVKALGTLDVGQTVQLKGLSPKYVNGLTAKIVGKGRTRFQVVLDNPPASGRFNGTVTVPANCVEPVSV